MYMLDKSAFYQQTLSIQSGTGEDLNCAPQTALHHAPTDQQPGGIPLRIDGVSKTFSGRMQTVEALLAVNLEVAAGEFVCLLGPSGCGKSTLLSVIAGLETATTGTVWANGREVRGPGTDRVLLFRKPHCFPGSTFSTTSSLACARPVHSPENGLLLLNTSLSWYICKASSVVTSTSSLVGCASASPLRERWQ